MKNVIVIAVAGLLSTYAYAVDGVVLINQSTVMAAGGFPYVISQPGSYKLSGNLSVPVNTNGIVITVSNVTLDLNGFTISAPAATCGPGSPSCFNPFAGITSNFGANNVAVRNGIISGFAYQMFLQGSGNLAEGLIFVFVPGGATSPGNAQFGPSSVIRHVIHQNGNVDIACPTVVADTVASAFLRLPAGAPGCMFANVSGTIF